MGVNFDDYLNEEDLAPDRVLGGGATPTYPFIQLIQLNPQMNNGVNGLFFLDAERSAGLNLDPLNQIPMQFGNETRYGYAWPDIEVLVLAVREDWGVSDRNGAKQVIGTYADAKALADSQGARAVSRNRILVMLRDQPGQPIMLTAWGVKGKHLAQAITAFNRAIIGAAQRAYVAQRVAEGKSGEISFPSYAIYCPLTVGAHVKASPQFPTMVAPIILNIDPEVLKNDAFCAQWAQEHMATRDEIKAAGAFWKEAKEWEHAVIAADSFDQGQAHEQAPQAAQPQQQRWQAPAAQTPPPPASAPTARPSAPPWKPTTRHEDVV